MRISDWSSDVCSSDLHIEKRFVCTEPDCLAVFSRRCDLQRHVATHYKTNLEDSIVQCSFPGCDRTFTQRKNMVAHLRACHDEEKRFVCDVPGCGLSFGFKHVLERHVQVMHLNEKQKKQKIDEKAKEKEKERVWQALTGFTSEQMETAMHMASPDSVTVSCEI